MKKSWLVLIALLFPLVVQSVPFSETPTAWRSTLPPDTLGYLRIPSPWELFSTSKDNVLKEALAHPQHVAQLKNLEASVYQNILTQAEVFTPLSFFFHHLRSPLEAVVLLPENTLPPFANLLLSAQLNFTSIAEFNQFLHELVAKTPALQMSQAVAANGYGTLKTGLISFLLHYEVKTQTLNIMGGLASNQAQFEQILAQRTELKEHPMYALEKRIDANHQGFFSWLNVPKLLSSSGQMLPLSVLEQLQKWGLDQMKGIAFGWGVSEGKSRLSFIVDAPKTGYLERFPAISNNFTLTASGKPGSVISFSLPALEWLQGIEQTLQEEISKDQFQTYLTAKHELALEWGFTLEDILQTFGPEMIFFTDTIGEFLALKIQNQAKLQQMVTQLTAKQGVTYRNREINGQRYHHLLMPSALLTELAADDEKTLSPEGSKGLLWFLVELAANIGSHYYWIEEEGYLILARVPQLLIDRQQHLERVSLQAWLKQQQRQDIQASMLVISTTIAGTPRRLYYSYLQILTFLADIAKTPLDLFTLPSATELNLPQQGTYGLQLDWSDSLLALELTFENNPLEFLLDIKMITTAALLSALTIPALLAVEEELEFSASNDDDEESESLLQPNHSARLLAENEEEVVVVAKEVEANPIAKPVEIEHKQAIVSPDNEAKISLTEQIADGFSLLSDLETPAEIFFSERGYLPEVDEIEDYAEIRLKGQYTQNLRLLDTKNGYGVNFQDPNLVGYLKLLYDPMLRTWSCQADNLPRELLPNACK